MRENDTLFGRKQHVVWGNTTRCLKENDTLFEEKRHVVWRKTTRCLWENATSVEEEVFEEVISDDEESKSGDFEDSSFSPKVW